MSPPPLLPRLDEEALFNWYLERIRHNILGHRETDTQHTVLPSRVLDLEWGQSTSLSLEADVRLIETRGENGEYATLSYCWGSYRGCITEQASYKDRSECIKFADLPKLFQEAVYVTRKLRIKYLWIDGLCIIQDSDADWQKEAAKMGEIYRNGQIRIAATVAKDPTESFYPLKLIVTSVRTK
ncbi:HET-domain-containing protein, partial [Mollisia scopiformis]